MSKIIGDPYWLYIFIDEIVFRFRRKFGRHLLFALRPSFQTLFVVARSYMLSHCSVRLASRLSHYSDGIGAKIGLEY
ncbi:hypothetical protein AADW59_00345 [Candidatus Hodgkinia cicadicola]